MIPSFDYKTINAQSHGMVRSQDPMVFTQLFEDRIGAVCWQRPVNKDIQMLAQELQNQRINIQCSGTPEQLAKAIMDLPDLPGRQALADDVKDISEMFAVLTDETNLGMRLVHVNTPMCPNWHNDRVMVRQIVSYGAAGTEFEYHSEASSETQLYQAHDHDVLLLKGDLWSKDGVGVKHRSPQGETPRLLLTLDLI